VAFEKVGIQAVVEGLSAFQRGIKSIEQGIDNVAKRAEASKAKVEFFGKALTGLGVAFTGAAAAGAALLTSSIRLAARVETLGVVTKRLGENVGFTEKEVRDLEQAIKSKGITLQASRTAIARMVGAEIDLARGAELARLAQDAAVIANVNSSDAFEHLIGVIVTGNVRMARTLGLQVSFQDSYEKMAASIGKTSQELTTQEKVAARTNAVIASGTNIAGAYEEAMNTAGKKVLSLDRHLEESRRILGEVWLPAFADAVDKVTEALEVWEDMDEVTQRATGDCIPGSGRDTCHRRSQDRGSDPECYQSPTRGRSPDCYYSGRGCSVCGCGDRGSPDSPILEQAR